MDLHIIFWGCLAGGFLFAIVMLLIGDGLMDVDIGIPAIHPVTLVGAITVFGGAGLILSQATSLSSMASVAGALISAVLSSILLYIGIVRPSKLTENSTGFRLADLRGKKGEVTVTIPSHGFGEVMILTATGQTNQIAASYEQTEIPMGSTVIVIDVKDQVLYVSPR